jgi:uncharacterized membrane protein
MITITGYIFDTAAGAEQMLDLIRDLSRQEQIAVADAALVTWPEGKERCTVRVLGALTSRVTPDDDIDRNIAKAAQEKLTVGTSALFLVTSDGVEDGVTEAVIKHGFKFDRICATYVSEKEQQLPGDSAT